MTSGFLFAFTCAAVSCVAAGSYLLAHLREETPPPGFLFPLSALVLIGLSWIVVGHG
jgi:hypothetical protein